MFTGLVQAKGVVTSVERTRRGMRLSIDQRRWSHRARRGDSISVSGCCLTVAGLPRRGVLEFFLVPETLAKTTLGDLKPGANVNLEHSATPTTLLGGHFVQGHVDGVGVVARVSRKPGWRVSIDIPKPRGGSGPLLADCLVPKGSICVDGVSLTIASCTRSGFDVALIPETLERTTLADLKAGDRVNLEGDIIAKTVVQWLEHHSRSRSPSRARR